MTEPTNQKQAKPTISDPKKFVIALVVVGLIAFAVGRYTVTKKSAATAGQSMPPIAQDSISPDFHTTEPTPLITTAPEGQMTQEQQLADDTEKRQLANIAQVEKQTLSVPAGETLAVEWKPISEQTHEAVNPLLPPLLLAPGYKDYWVPEDSYSVLLGKIATGRYAGYALTLQAIATGGLGESTSFSYLLLDSQKPPVLLAGHIFGISSMVTPIVSGEDTLATDQFKDATSISGDMRFDMQTTIPDLETPQNVSTLDFKTTFVLMGPGERTTKDDAWLFNEPGFPVTPAMHLHEDLNTPSSPNSQNSHEFIAVRKDGRKVWYEAKIPFWDYTPSADLTLSGDPFTTGVPTVSFGDKKNASPYVKSVFGGCGAQFGVNVVSVDKTKLKDIGSYIENGVSHSIQGLETTDETTFTNWKLSHANGTKEQYLALHPFFYWQDSLGRWIQFQNEETAPPGECGKPVLYFYPKTKTDLDVTLAPQGGFTKTEPAYGNGWHITASPDGSLVNKADGKTYPYLFWEGRGGFYESPKRYWVVKREDVHGFLVKTLADLGLNAKETADFIEFWEPRMQAAGYYKIGFHGTNVMNQIAPLTVSQTPDTLIRILMDYTELQTPISADPPRLSKPKARTGFTVIEWGGVLR